MRKPSRGSPEGAVGMRQEAREKSKTRSGGLCALALMLSLGLHLAASRAMGQDAGTVTAWGRNGDAQLGDGTTNNSSVPVQVLGSGGVGLLGDIVAVAGGNIHSAAVKSNGTVWCWGDNQYGQLGNGTTTDSPTPGAVVGSGGTGTLAGITAVSCGYGHTVARRINGTVWGWGLNGDGQLGDGTLGNRSLPVQAQDVGGLLPLTGVLAAAAGQYHTAALKTDGTVWAWGANSDGQLGDGTTIRHTTVQVLGPGGAGYLTGISAIACGANHTVALKNDGTVWTWGKNNNGQLGNGTQTSSSVPVQVVSPSGEGYLTGVTSVAAATYHTVARKADGTVWAWGSNSFGRLGDGTTTQRLTPVQVVGPGGVGYLTGVSVVAAGVDHTVALKSAGTVWCWGWNANGQLGNGTLTTSWTPVQVVGLGGAGSLLNIASVASRYSHTLARVGPPTIALAAACDWDWVYQNAPTTTQGRHKCVLTIVVTADPFGNSTYAVSVVRNAASTGQAVIESTADSLVWNIRGGQYGVDPFGQAILDVTVTGNQNGGAGSTVVGLDVRRLGDITGNGTVGLEDKVQINKCLNGLATPGYVLRHFDLNGGGTAGLDDKIIINKILNGLPVP